MPSACLTTDELDALLHGRVGAADSARFDRHLADCSACRQQLDARAGGGASWLKVTQTSSVLPIDSPPLREVMNHLTSGAPMPPSEKPGDRIGRYKLLEQIGEGGCGVVYVAEQEEPVRRRVALKVIKLGMDTQQVIARFEAERQALAMMDHPNIARVLDAGATDGSHPQPRSLPMGGGLPAGRPYFVMELVRGVKITDYCDDNKLDTAHRLDLFIQVCHAVQHAHQKGIIHRDLKPSNILVTINDGVPVPKVIDFGIAKATEGRLTDKTVYTQLHQFIGTPTYMSPEQALMTSLDIDTRSDIYSLGVLLYELLTGRTPLDTPKLLKAGLDEMRRTIRDVEPPRPSTRLSVLTREDLTTAAKRRSTHPPQLIHSIRGDLDWIVMKCLEKDRTRRYDTANGLAADVQRHLKNEPVVACPPSPLYRLQKMVRRNKLAFAAGSAVAASLVIGLTLSTLMFFRERTARKQAEEQTELARALSDFLTRDVLGNADTALQAQAGFTPKPNLTVREALERAAERIGDRFKDQPLCEAGIRFQIGGQFTRMGDTERAIEQLRRAVELSRAKLGPNNRATLIAMDSLAEAYRTAGKLDQALPLFEETLKLMQASFGPNHFETMDTMGNLANCYRAAGKLDHALTLSEETVRLRKATLGSTHRETLGSMSNLAKAYLEAGKLNQALPLLEETLKLMQATLRPGDPYIQITMGHLAYGYRAAERIEDAIPLREESLKTRKATFGPNNPNTLYEMANLAIDYDLAGKQDQALPLLEETLKRMKANLRPDDPSTLRVVDYLAKCYRQGKRFGEAETLYRDALDRLRAQTGVSPPPEIPLLGTLLHHLADVLVKQANYSAARPFAEEALVLYRRHADWPAAERRHALDVLGSVLKELGDVRALEAVRLETLRELRAAAEKEDVEALNTLAWLLATSTDSALRDGQSAARFAEKAVAKTDRKDWRCLDTLAAAHAEVGEFAQAVSAQREAISLCRDPKTKSALAARLKLYESNTPFRE